MVACPDGPRFSLLFISLVVHHIVGSRISLENSRSSIGANSRRQFREPKRRRIVWTPDMTVHKHGEISTATRKSALRYNLMMLLPLKVYPAAHKDRCFAQMMKV
jgi:hypothetical protein